jgi:hypothetical protein
VDDAEARTPRITAVMGLARALLDTLGPEEAVDVLLSEFGWDLSFQALALVRSEATPRALGVVCERLLLDRLRDEIDLKLR